MQVGVGTRTSNQSRSRNSNPQLENETGLGKGETTINRIFAIGDIHGCSIALQSLLSAIDPRPDDTIVVLGDVIDWGPESRGCVQQLIDLANHYRLTS